MCKKLRISGNVLLCFALQPQRVNARPLKRVLTRFGKSDAGINRKLGNVDTLEIYERLQFVASDFFGVEAEKFEKDGSGNRRRIKTPRELFGSK
jgi:hypothetical protein